MLLKPSRPLIESPIFDAGILDAIAEKAEQVSLAEALKKHNAGVTQIARVVSDVMHNGCSDSVRLRAAELASNMAGLGTQKEASNISIVIQDSNVQLNNLFCPTR